MITKKNLLTALLFLFVSCPVWSQILKSSGIIVKAGKGEIAYNTPTHIDNMDTDIKNSYIKGKAALEFGYRFRLQPNKSRFFYDIDASGGYSKYEYAMNFLPKENTQYTGSSGSNVLLSFSLTGMANYNIFKGLNIGLGVQPTVYIWEKKFFDIPLLAKVSYDLKYVELGFSYKYGLTRNYKVPLFKDNRLSQWQFSIYIPLWKK